jgi:hypothetical protein
MQTLADTDFASLIQKPFHPSPVTWKDQVLTLTRACQYWIASTGVASPYPDWHAVWLALPAARRAVYGAAD